jgi:hypothetical protein
MQSVSILCDICCGIPLTAIPFTSAGVGISGQEGMQAVMSADFAIAQFRFLEQLLLVHGRYSYKRICRMILLFLYKNLYFGITIFWYNALTVFSGQLIFNDFYMSLFNVVFTSLTPLAIGAFDQDIERASSLKYPALYMEGELLQHLVLCCSCCMHSSKGGCPASQKLVVVFMIVINDGLLGLLPLLNHWEALSLG